MDTARFIRQMENPDIDLYVLAEWLRNRKLEVDLYEHWSVAEIRNLKEQGIDMPNFCSPHQLDVRGTFGCISVIRGRASLGDYEIYCKEGDLFSGIRRYREIEHAGKTIYGLLTTGMFDEDVPSVFCVLEYLFGHSEGGDGPLQEYVEE